MKGSNAAETAKIQSEVLHVESAMLARFDASACPRTTKQLVPKTAMKTGTAISGPIRLGHRLCNGRQGYTMFPVMRGKQSSECEELDKVDRTRRHAQNGHE